MSEGKHTPGPWVHKEQMIYSELDNTGKTIAVCRDEANAQLIAVAPDLLAMVKRFVDLTRGTDWFIEDAVTDALDIIRKAESVD